MTVSIKPESAANIRRVAKESGVKISHLACEAFANAERIHPNPNSIFMARHSAQFILEDLNNEPGMWQIAKLTGLPMGVIVSAFENIFDGSDITSPNAKRIHPEKHQ